MDFIRHHTAKIIVLIIILAIAGSIVYLLLRPESAATPASESATVSVSQPTAKEPVATKTAGAYVDYSANALASATGTKLIFFYAPWCPQCRALEASIKESSIPNGVTIFKADYDSNQELRQKYGVTLQTTLVSVDDTGSKLSSYVAYDTPTFDAVKSAFHL